MAQENVKMLPFENHEKNHSSFFLLTAYILRADNSVERFNRWPGNSLNSQSNGKPSELDEESTAKKMRIINPSNCKVEKNCTEGLDISKTRLPPEA